jgi:streptogramin lyase
MTTTTCTTTVRYDTSAEFATGVFDSVSQDPSNKLDPGCVPGNLCLDSSKSSLPYIWIANSGDNTVVKLDTRTGQRFGPYSAAGQSPSRTAVDPRDGSVWVANRGYSNTNDTNLSNVAHLGADGKLICRADIKGGPRALALDTDGNMWAGAFYEGRMYRLSTTEVDRTQSPPRCKILNSVGLPGGVMPYGAAVDTGNRLWISNRGNMGIGPVSVDINNSFAVTQYPFPGGTCAGTYGIAVDSDRDVWIGNYDCATVNRLTPSTRTWKTIPVGGNPRGIAVSPDGHVYSSICCGGTANQVVRINRGTNAATFIAPPGLSHPIGVAIDNTLKVWSIGYSSATAARIDPTNNTSTFFATGPSPYTYSDMTGLQNLLFTKPVGTWTVIYDSGYATPKWLNATFTTTQAAGTKVSVKARSSATRAGLAAVAFSAEKAPSPVDLSTVPNNRFIELQIVLSTSNPNKTPVVQDVTFTWSR